MKQAGVNLRFRVTRPGRYWLYGSIDVHSEEGGTELSCERMSPSLFMKWYLSVGRL